MLACCLPLCLLACWNLLTVSWACKFGLNSDILSLFLHSCVDDHESAAKIPYILLLCFFLLRWQTILIQNIYRNPQNSAQTADASRCKCKIPLCFPRNGDSRPRLSQILILRASPLSPKAKPLPLSLPILCNCALAWLTPVQNHRKQNTTPLHCLLYSVLMNLCFLEKQLVIIIKEFFSSTPNWPLGAPAPKSLALPIWNPEQRLLHHIARALRM